MSEEWRDVIGYEGIYQVSSVGQVKRIAKGHGARVGRILRPKPHPGGYVLVTLSSNNQHENWLIHRLVAYAFLGFPPKDHEVNHKNGMKTDNRVSNLEWATSSENKIHSIHVLGNCLGEANGSSKLTAKQVKEIRKMRAQIGSDGKPRYTLMNIGRLFNVSVGNVSLIVNYKAWKHI